MVFVLLAKKKQAGDEQNAVLYADLTLPLSEDCPALNESCHATCSVAELHEIKELLLSLMLT